MQRYSPCKCALFSLEASKGDFLRFLNNYLTINALVFNTHYFVFFFSLHIFCSFFSQSKKPHLIFAKPHHYDNEKKCLKKKPQKSAHKCAFGVFFVQNFSFFHEKLEKTQKSDFPRKRSHFRKKDLGFVTTKKNSIFPKLFWGS